MVFAMRGLRSASRPLAKSGVWPWLFLLVCSCSFFCQPGNAKDSCQTEGKHNIAELDGVEEEYVAGRIRSVAAAALNTPLLGSAGMLRREIASVEVLEGHYAGKVFAVANDVTDNPAYNIILHPGQEVILSIVTTAGGKPEVNISDYRREHALAWLLAAFLCLFLLFGGKQGLKSLAGLVICIALIAFVLLPLSLKGVNPLLSASLLCVLATVATVLFSAGWSRKSAAAVCGTVGGVLVSGVAAQLVIQYAPLIGLSSEEAQILRSTMLTQPPAFYSGLLAAGMLIGALGVIMDVGISIASSVWEVSKADSNLSCAELYRRGMNVGRDIMGTMTTTLVLAYTGSALPLLLLAAQIPSTKLLNLDLVATEISAALAGSLGLVCTIPLTAFVSARLMSAGPRARKVTAADIAAIGNAPVKK